MNKRVIISCTSDLVVDQRVHKVALTLHNNQFEVLVAGRSSIKNLKRDYQLRIISTFFKKGFLFYAEINIRLFFLLLFEKADILNANDLDTLLPNYLVSVLKGSRLVYDSHEYFTEVPELQGRPLVKNFWKSLERWIFPKLKYVTTVSESIAALYTEEYKVLVKVVYNYPLLKEEVSTEYPPLNNVILYQGAVNKDRGLEELVQAMKYIENCTLRIIGDGDVLENLIQLTKKLKLEKKVEFCGKLPFDQLQELTRKATLGVSLEKDTNINYRYCLPNKVFDYIQAGIPVVVSDLPEMNKLVQIHNVGKIIHSISPEDLARVIKDLLNSPDQLQEWRRNAMLARFILSWQTQEEFLLSNYM